MKIFKYSLLTKYMLNWAPVTFRYLQLVTLQASVFRCSVLFLLAVSAKNSTRTSFVCRSVLQWTRQREYLGSLIVTTWARWPSPQCKLCRPSPTPSLTSLGIGKMSSAWSLVPSIRSDYFRPMGRSCTSITVSYHLMWALLRWWLSFEIIHCAQDTVLIPPPSAGPLLPHDKGCSTSARLPEASSSPLHLLPSLARTQVQDECQWPNLIHLPHWFKGRDQEKGAVKRHSQSY